MKTTNSRLLLFLFTTSTTPAATNTTIPNIDITLHPVNGKQIPAITSLQVAEIFGKQHKHVLRDIEQILTQVPEIFGKSNFGPTEYELKNNLGFPVKHPLYLITKDGFTLLTMGYTGEKAMKFKVAYINRFNEMEAELAQLANRVPDDPTSLGLPDFRNPVEAAKAWALAIEEKQEVEGRLAIAEPKAAVYRVAIGLLPAPDEAMKRNPPPYEAARQKGKRNNDIGGRPIWGRPPCLGKSPRKSPHNPNQANGQTPLTLEIVKKISQHPETGRWAGNQHITSGWRKRGSSFSTPFSALA